MSANGHSQSLDHALDRAQSLIDDLPQEIFASIPATSPEIKDFIFENLKESRHFQKLSEEALLKFMGIMNYVIHTPKEIILKQGANNHCVSMLIYGQVDVLIDGNYIYSLRRVGDLFGEMSVISGQPSSASIVAIEETGIITIDAKLLHGLQNNNSHELHHIFYQWFSVVLAEKLFLTSQKAKLHEESQKVLQQKNLEMTANLSELQIAYENLHATKNELSETKKIAQLTETFKKFVPEQFLNRLTSEGLSNIKVGEADNEFVTILFSDIRDFTGLSEQMSAQEVFNFLNAYLKRVSEPIHEFAGFIDKFIGDAILAIFNDPIHTDAHEAWNAVQAAIALQNVVNIYNEHRRNSNYPPIKIGIGIHSGPVMMGTIGSATRMDFTIIGDAVNIASRLEGMTKLYDVTTIISLDTYKLLDALPMGLWRELDIVRVKGKQKPIEVFEILAGMPEELLEQKRKILNTYYEGLVMFRCGEYLLAEQAFQECLSITYDRPSEIYLERSKILIKNPPSDIWDGVFTLTEK